MKFIQETGAIISQGGYALAYYDGTPGHVDFDFETIQKLHQTSPGSIWKFVHTHPIGMTELSQTDKVMLRTLAPVIYPFPARLSVITYDNNEIYEYEYIAVMESKESWKKSDRPFRDINIFLEDKQRFWKYELPWKSYIEERSYEI